MKLSVTHSTNCYKLSQEGEFRWYKKDARKIKQGITYRHMLSHYWTTNVDTIEIYTIREKDPTVETYWLIEHKILDKEGKLEFKPLYKVELDEESDSPGYWSIKTFNQKTILTPKEFDDLMKKSEEENKKKK